jgi:hypothetical protein
MCWHHQRVERFRPAWLLGLPLLAIGWLSAHSLAYELVAAEEHGHGYLTQAPLFLSVCAAAVALALGRRVAGRLGLSMPGWAAGLIPLLGFTVQEHLERALGLGVVPWGTALEPVFLLGLTLQLPFALAALVLARALAAVADAVTIQAEEQARFTSVPVLHRPAEAVPMLIPALAEGHAGRAPPVRV